ncbi:MAG: hypothetical protein JXA50_01595 [Deltaproteobacteria bacterium]|nr:hypothetical protein [Deltaproteobacteria bacterium]
MKIKGIWSTRQVFVDGKELSPTKSQGESSGFCQTSYEFSGDSTNFSTQGHLRQIKNLFVLWGNMDDKQTHPQSLGQEHFFGNISLKLNGSIYQYLLPIKIGNEINKKLITLSREINNILKSKIWEMNISSKNFSFSPIRFRFIDLESFNRDCSPDFSLEFEPSFLDLKVLISSPSIITNCIAKRIFIGSTKFLIENIRWFFLNDFMAEMTSEAFAHFLILPFVWDYNINTPTIKENFNKNDGDAPWL